ncbi:MAG TPA: TonB-dependent receptor plug domain-containing protein [Chitinophagaceae bacterium]|nr:TonB-dependent receptor plug domain-containing protein [Chitinophagaceae bacterium]
MNRSIFCFLFFFISYQLSAQADSVKEINLEEVVVKAFEQNRRLKDMPGAVNYIGAQNLRRFNDNSLVAAINSMPGVRMEERSPGSYRLNIRGSSARSPFGVRNVKIYYNDLPYTDPGGQSYLNQLGFHNINSVEIIKGPGNSLYGAGTGGVMLIESLSGNERGSISGGYTAGSYGLHHAHAALTTGSDKNVSRVQYQHLQTDGYRDQSRMRRDVISWDGIFRIDEKRTLKTTFLYSDLYYQTPGALTLNEYKLNPGRARPGAEASKAAIYQKTFLAGASYTQQLSARLANKSVLYGAFTELRNPNLRGYDKSNEPHVGGRSVFTYITALSKASIVLNAGVEWQGGFGTYSNFKNVNGSADSLRYYDDTRNRQSVVFAQATLDFRDWTLTTGASWNELRVRSQRYTPRALGEGERKFDNGIVPRITILKKIKQFTIYSGVSKGFSSPTTSELIPTGGAPNLDLEAEYGTNYDLGVRAGLFNKLYIDMNMFVFSLNNAIVVRKDASGGDFYVNAGKTKQHGIETYISYPLPGKVQPGLIWLGHSWHNFHYKNFKKGADDFSGNRLPGEPQHSITGGIDFSFGPLQTATTYAFNNKIPLNDANTAYLDESHIVGLKLSYRKTIKDQSITVFTGIENLLNQTYSLGNDINAVGARYYNAAAGRNYYAGIRFGLTK